MEFEEACRILAALQKEGVRYVLIGSMAMAAHGLVRATRDLDFFVSPDEDNIARLRRALRQVFGQDPSIDEIQASDLAGDYPAIEYMPPSSSYSLDILARLGEAFSFDDLEWDELQIEEITVRVATARMLYRMKRDTVRPQDKVDAAALRERFKLEDE